MRECVGTRFRHIDSLVGGGIRDIDQEDRGRSVRREDVGVRDRHEGRVVR